MAAVILACGAGLALGGFLAAALSRWQPAFPALFLAGVAAFLAWNAIGLWRDSGDDAAAVLAAFSALVGWIVGVTAGLTARRGRRALRTRNLGTHVL